MAWETLATAMPMTADRTIVPPYSNAFDGEKNFAPTCGIPTLITKQAQPNNRTVVPAQPRALLKSSLARLVANMLLWCCWGGG